MEYKTGLCLNTAKHFGFYLRYICS